MFFLKNRSRNESKVKVFKFELCLRIDDSTVYRTSIFVKELVGITSKYECKILNYKTFGFQRVEIKLRCTGIVFRLVLQELLDRFPLLDINSFKGV